MNKHILIKPEVSYGTAVYWDMAVMSTAYIGMDLARSPQEAVRRHDGAWKCSYCGMIGSVIELNCVHCGAPGENIA